MGSSHSTRWLIEPVIIALKGIHSASEAIPIPYIPLAAGILAKLLENIQLTHENKKNLLELAHDATQLVFAITTEYQKQGNQKDWEEEDLKDAGNEIVGTLRKLNALVEKRAKRSRGRRFLTALADRDAIQKYGTKLNFAATKFQIRLQLEQRQDIQKMADDILCNLQEVKKDVQEIRQAVDEQNALRDLEKWVSSAAKLHSEQRFPPPRCDEGSRELVTQYIVHWCQSQHDDDVLWLNAYYGSGKSAIMQTVAEKLEKLKDPLKGPILGGTFFFGRAKPTRNQSIFLVPTIAEQIGRKHPDFRRHLLKAIDDDPSILHKFDAQATELLGNPLSKTMQSRSDDQPLIILIDGLDECEGFAEGSTYTGAKAQLGVLNAVRYLSESKLHLRFVVASRPEKHIQGEFEGKLKAISTSLSLHDDAWLSEGYRNIAQTIYDGFEEIRSRNEALLGRHWPSDHDRQRLIYAAGDQYLYAHTVLGFVGNEHFLPDEQLAIVLLIDADGHAEAFAPMDTLLRHILGTCPPQQQKSMLLVLAALTVEPQSLSSLAALTGVRSELVTIILRRLAGIVDTKVQYEEDYGPTWSWLVPERLEYSIHHISTKEFLRDATRSGAFYIGPQHDIKLRDNACALFTRLLLGECHQVKANVWCSLPLYLKQNLAKLLEVLDSFVEECNSEQEVFSLSSTQRRALWLVDTVLLNESHVAVACRVLLRASTIHVLTNNQLLPPIVGAISCIEIGYRGQDPPLNAIISQCPSFHEIITLFHDMFKFEIRDFVSSTIGILLQEEVNNHTSIGVTIASTWLRALTTAFSSLYPDKYTGMEITWFLQQCEQLGDADFDWHHVAWDATFGGVTHPTVELKGFLERVVEILDIARRNPKKPPANFARLFEPDFMSRNIQWWVRALKQALGKTEVQKDDLLLQDITRLIEELDDRIDELEFRGLRQRWIKRPNKFERFRDSDSDE